MTFLNKVEVDTKTIIFGALSFFYLFIMSYAAIVYQQFTVLDIIITGMIFLTLLIFLILLFQKINFKDLYLFKINSSNIVLSFLLFVLLLLYFFNEPSWLSYYYSTYPLIETDLGLFWHEDTAFHVSLIQSIINFGYPSISQHDVLILYYHTLSHYIDALIVILTGLEPYDSYGLFFYFKKWLLISSIIIFICRLFINKSAFLFLSTLVLLLPLFLYSWHSIGSHGLWFTTILMLFIFPNIFNILQTNEQSIKSYLSLFIVIVLISLGKISTGFFLGVFIGFYLLLKNYRDYKLYLFGISLIGFYLFMETLFNQGAKSIDEVYMPFYFNGIWDFMTNKYLNHLLPIYIYIITSLVLVIFLKKSIFKEMFLSSLLTFIVLLIIIQIGIFSTNNIFYFVYGLYTITLLFFITTFSHEISNKQYTQKNKLILSTSVIVLLIILNNIMKYNEISIDKFLNTINNNVFTKINTYKPSPNKVNMIKLVTSDLTINFNKQTNGLKQFRTNLYKYMDKGNLSKQNTLIYIPEEVYKNELTQKEWAKGMLVYAVLGVPLVNALHDLRAEYGYSNYSTNGLRKDLKEINIKEMCKNEKTIIIVNSFTNKEFYRLCK